MITLCYVFHVHHPLFLLVINASTQGYPQRYFQKIQHMVHNVCSVRANEFELFPADVQFADSAFIIWVSRYNLNTVYLVELIDHINNMTSNIL